MTPRYLGWISLLALAAACAKKPEGAAVGAREREQAETSERAEKAEKSEREKEKPAVALPSPASRVAAGPLAARTLDGPFASLDAWCESLQKGPRPPKKCLLDEEGKPALERAAAPWLAAKTIQSGRFDDRQLRVAVQTAAGWFVSRPSGEAVPIIATTGVTARAVVAGGGAELVVRYVEIAALADGEGGGRWAQRCTERWAVCGMLDGERPGCTPPIAMREGGCKDANTVEWEWELDAQTPGDGNARIAAKRGAPPPPAMALLGTHALGLR